MNLGQDHISGSHSSSKIRMDEEVDYKKGLKSDSPIGAQSIDSLVYDGIDMIGHAGTHLQYFQSQADKSSYEAPIRSALLPVPDVERASNPEPYGIPEQLVIRRAYATNVLNLIKERNISSEEGREISDFLLLQKPLPTKKLTQIAQKINQDATQLTQTQAGLPATWTISSTKGVDWTREIDSTAEIITPEAIAKVREEQFILNSEALVSSIQAAAIKVSDSLPTHDPNKVSLQDFISVIGQAIRELKQALRQMQIVDAEKTKEFNRNKYDEIDVRSHLVEAQIAKQKQMREEQDRKSNITNALKWAGIGGSVAVLVIGAVLAPFTAGTSLPVAIATVAVGTTMTTYSIIDSELGLTQQLIQAFDSFLEDLYPGDDNAIIRSAIKAAFVAVISAVIVAVIAASAGSAATTVASQAAGNVAMQAVKETAKQLAITLLMMTIMTSNAIPELISRTLIEAGAIDPNDPKHKFIVEIIASVVVMVTLLFAAAYLSKIGAQKLPETGTAPSPSPSTSTSSTTSTSSSSTATSTAAAASSAAASAASTTTSAASTGATTAATEAQNAAQKVLAKLIKELENLLKRAADSIKNFSASDTAGNTGRGFKNIASGFASRDLLSATEAGMKARLAFLTSTHKLFQTSSYGLQAWEAAIHASTAFKVSELFKELGELEKAEEMTQAFIKVLNQTLRTLEQSIDANNDFVNSLQNDYNSLYTTAFRIVNKLFQA